MSKKQILLIIAATVGFFLTVLLVVQYSRGLVPVRFKPPPTLEEVMSALEAEAAQSQVRADSLTVLTRNLRRRLDRLQFYRMERVRITTGTRNLLQTAIDSLESYVHQQDSLAVQLGQIIAELEGGRVLLAVDTTYIEPVGPIEPPDVEQPE